MHDVEIKKLGSGNLELIPGELIARRKCSQCLHWEDPTFWTADEPSEILETKKENWFKKVSAEFDPCGLIAVAEGQVVAFAEYAMPKHFPGIREVSVKPEDDIPFIACFAVESEWQGSGVGSKLYAALQEDLRSRGFKKVQTLVRKAGGHSPSGPLDFWLHNDFTAQQESEGFVLAAKSI